MKGALTDKIKEMISEDEKKSATDITTLVDRISECLQRYDYLSVFDMDNKLGVKEIDVVMLQALLKGFLIFL